MRQLVRRFSSRTVKMRSQIEQPATPLSSNSLATMALDGSERPTLPSPDRSANYSPFTADNQIMGMGNPLSLAMLCGGRGSGGDRAGVLDPQGKFYISWLCIVSVSFVYNAWVIPLRSTFPVHTPDSLVAWLILDFCADVIYMLDVIFIKHRVMYLYDGFWVRNKDLTRRHYMRKWRFKVRKGDPVL